MSIHDLYLVFDASIQEFLHILPTRGMSRSGRVAVGQAIDKADGGMALNERVDIDRGERRGCPTLKQESCFDNTSWLVLVRPCAAESGAGCDIQGSNKRQVSADEEALVLERRGQRN